MRIITKIAAGFVAAAITACAVVYAQGNEQLSNTYELPDTTVLEIGSNRHTRAESNPSAAAGLSVDGFELKLANDRIEVWFNQNTKGIRVADRKNGYVWGGLSSNEAEGMNDKWCAMANSLCTIEYFNNVNAESRISISDDSAETDFQWKESSVNCAVSFKKQGIEFSFTLKLNNDGMNISVDKGSLKESGKCFIKSLYFLPFFGCAKKDTVDGYLFIPDGPGALIRFGAGGNYVSGYEEKIYGLDMGLDTLTQANDLQANRTNDYLSDAPQITMPVFGICHGVKSNAFLGIVDGGVTAASVVASPAGVTTDYYWSTTRFDYRNLYVVSTGTDGKGSYTIQKKAASVIPSVTYKFFCGEEADYSGMAVSYREILRKQGILGSENKTSEIPLRLDVAGSEIKEGILFNSAKVFTTAKQAGAFRDTLSQIGINNITMVFEGWQRGGINGSGYGTVAFNKKVGSKSDMERLRDSVTQNKGSFYLQVNPVTANKDQIKPQESAVITISNSLAKFVRPNTDIMYYESYVLKPLIAVRTIEKYRKSLDEFSLSFQQLGSRLYSEYTRGESITRSGTMKEFAEALKQCNSSALIVPNQYLWKYTKEYFDIPTANSQYLYETDTVPFLQIVLKGSIDYYAPYANQGFYSQDSILKMIEYGCYPSFMVTDSDNYSLSGTPLSDYFSLNFEDWLPTVQNVYKQLNEALSAAEGQYITDHEVIGTGVVKISYSGGTIIYVNYNSAACTADGITVPARGYSVGRDEM